MRWSGHKGRRRAPAAGSSGRAVGGRGERENRRGCVVSHRDDRGNERGGWRSG